MNPMTQNLLNLVKELGKYWKKFNDRYTCLMMSNFTLMGKFHTELKFIKSQSCSLVNCCCCSSQQFRREKQEKVWRETQATIMKRESKKKVEEKLKTNNHECLPLQMQYFTYFSSFFFIPLTLFLLTSRLCNTQWWNPGKPH
jgi:hypothetical protein